MPREPHIAKLRGFFAIVLSKVDSNSLIAILRPTNSTGSAGIPGENGFGTFILVDIVYIHYKLFKLCHIKVNSS